MDPIVKALLNSLRCPICKSGIDLIDWRSADPNQRKHNYGCCSNVEHYRIFLIHWDIFPKIQMESCIIYDGKFQYEINQYSNNIIPTLINTEILIKEVDPEHRILDKTANKCFSYDKKLFDFANTNKEKIINRIRTILVFQ